MNDRSGGASAGLDLVFDSQMGVHPDQGADRPVPMGIGFSVGLALDILPVDGSAAATYSLPLH